MKVTSSLALVTIFAAAASAFGLNNGATSAVKSVTRNAGFGSKSMVQPVDVQGKRLNTVVSASCEGHHWPKLVLRTHPCIVAWISIAYYSICGNI
jgi:hypothetical protein